MKKTIFLTVKQEIKQEFDVEFPIYREHGDEGWDSWTRIDEDGNYWTITRRHWGCRSEYEFETREKYSFDGSSPDYHLGRGMYSSSEADFYSALNEMRKAISEVPDQETDVNDENFVQQRMPADCAVAALAMFLGKPYEEIGEQCSGIELCRLGLSWAREAYILDLFNVEADVYAPTVMDWSRPAILSVPTINEAEGGTHSIYWDGKRVWDPQMGRPGKASYTNQQALEFVITAIQRPHGGTGA